MFNINLENKLPKMTFSYLETNIFEKSLDALNKALSLFSHKNLQLSQKNIISKTTNRYTKINNNKNE